MSLTREQIEALRPDDTYGPGDGEWTLTRDAINELCDLALSAVSPTEEPRPGSACRNEKRCEFPRCECPSADTHEVAWLVERPGPEWQSKIETPPNAVWTTDPNRACRYPSKKAANGGFSTNWKGFEKAEAKEHMWPATHPAAGYRMEITDEMRTLAEKLQLRYEQHHEHEIAEWEHDLLNLTVAILRVAASPQSQDAEK